MTKAPKEIDGATVLAWAWSGERPFGIVQLETGGIAAEIFGLAICKYPDGERFYRFSCDSNWDTEQDSEYSSIQEAKDNLPTQYQNVKAIWHMHD